MDEAAARTSTRVDVAEGTERLQRSTKDLGILLDLPASWSGGDAAQMVDAFVDAVAGLLRLDFIYVRLKGTATAAPIEVSKVTRSHDLTMPLPELGKVFRHWLEHEPRTWPEKILNPVGNGDISIVALRLALRDELGILVVGSQRTDFPQEAERLLLSVAANRAALAAQDVRWAGLRESMRTEGATEDSELDPHLILDSIPALVVVMAPGGEI